MSLAGSPDSVVHFDQTVAVTVAQEGKEDKVFNLRILIQSIQERQSGSSSSSSIERKSTWRSIAEHGANGGTELFTLPPQPSSSSSFHGSSKKLMVRFSDEEDHFFLFYTLIGEADFQRIKKENSIQCEFRSFPQMLIHLIEKSVIPVEHQREADGKCYTNYLELRETDAAFIIFQSDEFRQLTYLHLRLRAGSDDTIKEFLSAELRVYKTLSERLEKELNETKQRLSRQLNEAQQKLRKIEEQRTQLENERSETLAQQKHYYYDQIQKIKEAHESQIQNERQQVEMSRKMEVEKLQQKIDALESEVKNLTKENRELMERNLRLEGDNASQSAQLSTLREEMEGMKKEMSRLVTENATLSSQNNENTSTITNDKILISRFQQQVKDQEARIVDLQGALESEKQTVGVLQEHVEELKGKLGRGKEREKHLVNEIAKGNIIIQKQEAKLAKQVSRTKAIKQTLLQTESVLKNSLRQQRIAEKEKEKLNDSLETNKDKIAQLESNLQSKINELDTVKQMLEREKETNRALAEELRSQKSREFKSSMYSGFHSSSLVTTGGGPRYGRSALEVGTAPGSTTFSPARFQQHSFTNSSSQAQSFMAGITLSSSREVNQSGHSIENTPKDETRMTAMHKCSNSDSRQTASDANVDGLNSMFDENGNFIGRGTTKSGATRRTQAGLLHNTRASSNTDPHIQRSQSPAVPSVQDEEDASGGKVLFDVTSAGNRRFY